ncbi:YoaK family protein [Streptomyces sp. NPDC001840]
MSTPSSPDQPSGQDGTSRPAATDRLGSSWVVLALTLTTGSVDAISFLALGGVFTSVMTANMALLGLAVGSQDLSLAAHALMAFGGYVCGALAGTRIAVAKRGPLGYGAHQTALAVELLVLCGVLACWMAVSGRPGPGTRIGLLVAAAFAMGCQSAVVRVAGAPNVSTTYLTGTLTGVLAELATKRRLRWKTALLILTLPIGAAWSGYLVTDARFFAPVLPVAFLTVALVTSVARERGFRQPAERPPR